MCCRIRALHKPDDRLLSRVSSEDHGTAVVGGEDEALGAQEAEAVPGHAVIQQHGTVLTIVRPLALICKNYGALICRSHNL